MRNFSMKKFGTPMRAGPGVASDTVGLSSVGEPSTLRVGLDSSTLGSVSFSAFFSNSPVKASVLGSSVSGSLCVGVWLRPFLPPPLFPRAGEEVLGDLSSAGGSPGLGVGVGVLLGGASVAEGVGVAGGAVG